MEKVMEFLRSTKLEKYKESFENNGYDKLDFIESTTDVQLNNMLRTVGIYEKPDHKWKAFCGFFDTEIQEEAFSTKSSGP